jgi:hypothetical protein
MLTIRMGILHIMREYGIKEGHRPVSSVLKNVTDFVNILAAPALQELHFSRCFKVGMLLRQPNSCCLTAASVQNVTTAL